MLKKEKPKTTSDAKYEILLKTENQMLKKKKPKTTSDAKYEILPKTENQMLRTLLAVHDTRRGWKVIVRAKPFHL